MDQNQQEQLDPNEEKILQSFQRMMTTEEESPVTVLENSDIDEFITYQKSLTDKAVMKLASQIGVPFKPQPETVSYWSDFARIKVERYRRKLGIYGAYDMRCAVQRLTPGYFT
ncbi:hypothetical protein Taro_030673 [Colocasia esculenta]|uniref:Uncharacterized protein n=1 Tax=Colocasia esculenta TaxID=4460 RepID=A0A843VUN0_COLES|nr:hypothetical protein [Colocasia esculenta]